MKSLVLAAALAATVTSAMPAPCNCFATVSQLLGNLSIKEVSGQHATHLYIAGVSDAGQGMVHCAPPVVDTVTVLELIKPVLLASAPDQMAAHVILKAMAAAYPCTGAQPGDKPS